MNRTARKLAFLIASAMGLCLSSCQLLPTLNHPSSLESSSQSFPDESAPDHVHVFDREIEIAPADCENPAKHVYVCECGEQSEHTFESGSPLGHDFTAADYGKIKSANSGNITFTSFGNGR